MQVPVKKNLKKESKTDWNLKGGLAHSALLECWTALGKCHFPSTEWHKIGPRPEGIWIKLKHLLFYFLEIRTHPNSYSDHLAIFSSLPTSINRGCISKFRRLFMLFDFLSFWLSFSIIFSLTLKTFWRL